MLAVKLVHQCESTLYGKAIQHLALNTRVSYKHLIIGEESPFQPSFDISQTCCWVCEKPLGNGMYMCTHGGDTGTVQIIKEPAQEDDMDDDDISKKNLTASDLMNLVLLCGDCMHGLSQSLLSDKTRIHDPMDESLIGRGWNLKRNFLWPTELQETEYFVYRKKDAMVYTYDVAESNSMDSLRSETSKNLTIRSHVFIEPNPHLSESEFIQAKNTIQLFKLNGGCYDYQEKVHTLRFNEAHGQSIFNDLRLLGRNKAYDRAQTALTQFKSIRELYADPKLNEMLIAQQRVLVELNGYRSVWISVFNDGNDPGSLAQILKFPKPILPLLDGQLISADFPLSRDVDTMISEVSWERKGKDVWNLGDPSKFIQSVEYELRRKLRVRHYEKDELRVMGIIDRYSIPDNFDTLDYQMKSERQTDLFGDLAGEYESIEFTLEEFFDAFEGMDKKVQVVFLRPEDKN